MDRPSLSRAAGEISGRYQRGHSRGALLRSDADRLAYIQTRLPATYAAIHHVLVAVCERMPDMKLESLLDLGAGPGAAMWATLDLFPDLRKITLVEHDRNLVDIGRRLGAASPHRAAQAANWVNQDFSTSSLPPHDVVVLSYVLNELSVPAAARVALAAWSATRKLLVIIEPGTPRNFGTVVAARQMLIDAGAQIIAPCPHHGVCPLAAANDWCHFAARVERSSAHRRLKRGTLGYEDEKYSYVVAGRIRAEGAHARIIRHPLFLPGHVQLTLCTSEGLRRETVSRSQKERYRAARNAHWGDVWD